MRRKPSFTSGYKPVAAGILGVEQKCLVTLSVTHQTSEFSLFLPPELPVWPSKDGVSRNALRPINAAQQHRSGHTDEKIYTTSEQKHRSGHAQLWQQSFIWPHVSVIQWLIYNIYTAENKDLHVLGLSSFSERWQCILGPTDTGFSFAAFVNTRTGQSFHLFICCAKL